jgi:hypothetical protein
LEQNDFGNDVEVIWKVLQACQKASEAENVIPLATQGNADCFNTCMWSEKRDCQVLFLISYLGPQTTSESKCTYTMFPTKVP